MVTICYDTPKSILDAIEYDVFDEAIPSAEPPATDPPYRDLIVAEMWRQYRYRGITAYCHTGIDATDPALQYWVQLFTDRYESLIIEYEPSILNWLSAVQNDLIGDDTEEKLTVTGNGNTEDLPDTPLAAGDEYLSTRYHNESTSQRTTAPYYERIKRMAGGVKSPIRTFCQQFEEFFINFR